MKIKMRFLSVLLMSILSLIAYKDTKASSSPPLRLVCVEAVWCNIAEQLAGDNISSFVILRSQGIEPHHFTPSISTIRQMKDADILVVNGAHYDDWALSSHKEGQVLLNISDLIAWKEGDDPHLFFDIEAVNIFAEHLSAILIDKDHEKKAFFMENLKIFQNSLIKLEEKQKMLSTSKAHQKIALIEPAGLRLLEPLHFDIIDRKWAFNMMNDQSVSPRDTAFLEENIQKKTLHFLVINPIIEGGFVNNIIKQAQENHIPLIEISEYLPDKIDWQDWIGNIYHQIEMFH